MIVRAKRLGWDEVLTAEQEFDMDDYDHEDNNLEGELQEITIPATKAHPTIQLTLVGGQEADPKTVKPL